MNIAKMRRHVAGYAERLKADEERWRALFESGVMTKQAARFLYMPSQATFSPFALRHRLPSIKAASDPIASTTPVQPGP